MVDVILEATARVLIKRGYAKTNTNLIAEAAGISIGSLYQYFPNKDALIAAVHERHVRQMRDMMISVLSQARPSSIEETIGALVRAMLDVHLIAPRLHHVLEKEFPFSGSKDHENSADQEFLRQFQLLLGKHGKEIKRPNLEIATYVVLGIVRSLVHQSVLEKHGKLSQTEILAAIKEAVLGYLTLPA